MRDIEEYLNHFFRGTKEPSLDAMKFFMNEYGDFQKEMKFIHVAGTNGKGSCVETICNILEKQGYHVGKYLSPHLVHYHERIQINHQEITDRELWELINELEPKIKEYEKKHEIPVTLFELETTMALLYFYRKKVDFTVLEVGCGGLYDCTNIISHSLVSVISSIGYDHMQILGETLPEIATQKAGIIKHNSYTVIHSQTPEIDQIFQKTCQEKNNELRIITDADISNYRYDQKFQYFDVSRFKNIAINLKGKKQVNNALLCIEVMAILNELGYYVSEENIREGLKTVVHRGRMETIRKNPLMLYDGAHNIPAMENFYDMVKMYYSQSGCRRAYIVSILKRKAYKEMLKILLQDEQADFYFTSGNDEEKYTAGETLYQEALPYKTKQLMFVRDLATAIQEVKSKQYDVTFIVGSFYVYGDVIKMIQEEKGEKNYESIL